MYSKFKFKKSKVEGANFVHLQFEIKKFKFPGTKIKYIY